MLAVAAIVLSALLPTERAPIDSTNGAASVIGQAVGMLVIGGIAALIHAAIRRFGTRHTRSVMITWTVVVLLVWVSALAVANFEAQSAETVRHEFLGCMAETQDQDQCLDRLGRHSWFPQKVDSCYAVRDILEFAHVQGWKLSWKVLFLTNAVCGFRCRTLSRRAHSDAHTKSFPPWPGDL